MNTARYDTLSETRVRHRDQIQALRLIRRVFMNQTEYAVVLGPPFDPCRGLKITQTDSRPAAEVAYQIMRAEAMATGDITL